MKSLWLLRHAKAVRDASIADDHERPLAPRGVSASERIGAYIGADAEPPTLVLCSSARRTRETLDGVLAQLPKPPQVEVERELYLAEAPALLARIREIDDAEPAALVIGHNPGIALLALGLAVEDASEARRLLEQKFPTAALAVLAFPVERWADLRPGRGRLRAFVTPKQLENDGALPPI